MELNFKSFGHGNPVLILHGLFGMLDNWQSFARKLAQNYHVVIVDLPNHGKSPELFPFNYPIMGEVIREFMEDNWLHSAHVIGHSMGGKAAMQLALDHPEMVTKLVVVDIAPLEYAGGHEKIIQSMVSLSPENIVDRTQAKEYLLSQLKSETTVNFLMKNLSRTKEGGYQWKFNLENLKRAYPDILQSIYTDSNYDDPSLFIRGDQSDYITDKSIESIENLFPAYELQTINNAGHWVHADQPDKLLDLITGFLR